MPDQEKTIQVGPELFRFTSVDDWVRHAKSRYEQHGYARHAGPVAVYYLLAIDKEGQVCTRGEHFSKAAYPVTVHAIDWPEAIHA
jgi:hypothetical protein